MLWEPRKYHVGLLFSHQHLYQLAPEMRHAVLGNVGMLVSFRIGSEDPRTLAREFAPTFVPEDFVKLPNHGIYLKLIDGFPSGPLVRQHCRHGARPQAIRADGATGARLAVLSRELHGIRSRYVAKLAVRPRR